MAWFLQINFRTVIIYLYLYLASRFNVVRR